MRACLVACGLLLLGCAASPPTTLAARIVPAAGETRVTLEELWIDEVIVDNKRITCAK